MKGGGVPCFFIFWIWLWVERVACFIRFLVEQTFFSFPVYVYIPDIILILQILNFKWTRIIYSLKTFISRDFSLFFVMLINHTRWKILLSIISLWSYVTWKPVLQKFAVFVFTFFLYHKHEEKIANMWSTMYVTVGIFF